MADKPRKIKRSKKLSANATGDEITAFYDACEKADIEPSDTLRKLAKALEQQVEEYGYVTFPLKLARPEPRVKKD